MCKFNSTWYLYIAFMNSKILLYKYLIFFVFSNEWKIDHSVVESFGAGGKTNILSRVYPELAVMNQAHLFVFNNGTEPIVVQNLKAWSMISADIK